MEVVEDEPAPKAPLLALKDSKNPERLLRSRHESLDREFREFVDEKADFYQGSLSKAQVKARLVEKTMAPSFHKKHVTEGTTSLSLYLSI